MVSLQEIISKTYTSRDDLYAELKDMAREQGFTVQLASGGNLNPAIGTVKAHFKCGSGGFKRDHHKHHKAEDDTLEDKAVSDIEGTEIDDTESLSSKSESMSQKDEVCALGPSCKRVSMSCIIAKG